MLCTHKWGFDWWVSLCLVFFIQSFKHFEACKIELSRYTVITSGKFEQNKKTNVSWIFDWMEACVSQSAWIQQNSIIWCKTWHKKCTCNDKLNCEESIELRGLNIRSRMWIETKINSILYTYRTTKERTMAVDIAVQTDAIKCRGNFLCLPFECAREFYAICFHSFFFIYCRSFAFSLNVS